MGYNPSDSIARRSRERRQEQQETATPAALDRSSAQHEISRQRVPMSATSLYKDNGLVASNTSVISTPNGEQVAAAKRFKIGPIELSERIDAPGFQERQILGIPVYRRGTYNALANHVHNKVNAPFHNTPSAKDANVERGSPSRSIPADRRQQTATAHPSQETIAQNRKALLASTGKEHPTNQDVYNALRRHYGSDRATYRNAERDFGINAGALVKDQSTRHAVFGQAVSSTQQSAPALRAIPVPEAKQENIPRAVPVPEPKQQATPQQVINSYYHGAGVTRAERNSAAGFNKAQAYATKLGPEHRAAFDAAVAARRSQ